MKKINYVDYKYSYAHALESKLRVLNFHANVQPKPVGYLKKIIINSLNQEKARFTEKEQEFYSNVVNHNDSKMLYFYVKNAIKKARETFVLVDDNGELICK